MRNWEPTVQERDAFTTDKVFYDELFGGPFGLGDGLPELGFWSREMCYVKIL
jgi:hypothetical protein